MMPDRLLEQNTKLDARVQALERFARSTTNIAVQSDPHLLIQQAQEIALSLLSHGYALYYEREDTHWRNRVQVGKVGNADLQAFIDAGPLVGETPSVDVPWTTGETFYQDVYAQGSDTPATMVQHVNAAASFPVKRNGETVGVFIVVLFEQRVWTDTDKAVLETIVSSLRLALELAEQIRQREIESHAQEAFVAFTEAVGIETDVLRLAQQAIQVIQANLVNVSVVYYEREQLVWKGKVWSEDVAPEMVDQIRSGVPVDIADFARAVQEGTAIFVDDWNAEENQLSETAMYGAGALVPLVIDGEAHGMFTVGKRDAPVWVAREQRIVRAVGRSLRLALERAEQAQRLQLQKATVESRNRALEAFAQLTREMVTETNRYTLIRRAQEIVLSLLPSGFAVYYESNEGLWRIKAQVGDIHSGLQTLLDAGLPFEAPSPHRPWTTGEPFYQDNYAQGSDTPPEVSQTVKATVSTVLRMQGEPIGVFSVALFEQWAWTSVDRMVLSTALRNLELALDRAAAAEQLRLQKEAAEQRSLALEAFAVLSRDLAGETSRYALVHRAQEIMMSLLTPGYALYWEETDDHWELKSQVGDIGNPELQRLVDEQGLPLDAPALHSTWLTGVPNYQDNYVQGADTPAEMIRHVQAATAFQVKLYGKAIGMLAIGLFDQRSWTPMDKAALETAIYSLGLVLERSQTVAALAERTGQLETLNGELKASNEELEAFTYSASHDLRTPVRHIMGFAELAEKAIAKGQYEKVGSSLEVVKQGALRMTSLIDGMLVLSRSGRQQLHIQSVDLNILVTQGRRDAAAEFGSHPVHWQIGSLPTVQGDHSLLQQVMTNLLSNAVKYSAKRERSEVRVWCKENASDWTIRVQDNGVGFDPAHAQKLFGIFQRLHTEKDFKGTGVGLATMRRIVQKHGGQVFAESDGHSGATFSFTLPK